MIRDYLLALFIIYIIALINSSFIVLYPKNQLQITFLYLITIFVSLQYFFPFKKINMNKKLTIIAFIILSISGPIVESIMIHFSPKGSTWIYGNTYPGFNVPIWLTMSYGIFSLASITIYCCLNDFINTRATHAK